MHPAPSAHPSLTLFTEDLCRLSSTLWCQFHLHETFPSHDLGSQTTAVRAWWIWSGVSDPKAFSFEGKGRNPLPPASNRRRRPALMLWSISSMDNNKHTWLQGPAVPKRGLSSMHFMSPSPKILFSFCLKHWSIQTWRYFS